MPSFGFSFYLPKNLTPACPKMGWEVAQLSDNQMILGVSTMASGIGISNFGKQDEKYFEPRD